MNFELCKTLALKHNVELRYATDLFAENQIPPHYLNASYFSGGRNRKLKPQITLGVYDDAELQLLSFFHELGHAVNYDNNLIPTYENLPYSHFAEASAWRRGLRLAARNGVVFSEAAIEWAKTQLASYFADDNLERTPLRYLEQALDYAFADPRMIYERHLMTV